MDGITNTLIPITEQKDSVVWTLTPTGSFTIKSAWQKLRQPHPEVLWSKSIWFKRHVPRRAIIQWIATWGRLSTKDFILRRLRAMIIFSLVAPSLLLCGTKPQKISKQEGRSSWRGEENSL